MNPHPKHLLLFDLLLEVADAAEVMDKHRKGLYTSELTDTFRKLYRPVKIPLKDYIAFQSAIEMAVKIGLEYEGEGQAAMLWILTQKVAKIGEANEKD